MTVGLLNFLNQEDPEFFFCLLAKSVSKEDVRRLMRNSSLESVSYFLK